MQSVAGTRRKKDQVPRSSDLMAGPSEGMPVHFYPFIHLQMQYECSVFMILYRTGGKIVFLKVQSFPGRTSAVEGGAAWKKGNNMTLHENGDALRCQQGKTC